MIDFIVHYWSQLLCLIGVLGTLLTFIIVIIESVRCSLRNDILQIYDLCKKDKQISTYQMEALLMSTDLYFKLKGNGFVHKIVEEIKQWEVI